LVPTRTATELPELTDEQLRRYHAELAHSLRGLPRDAPVRDLLGRKLALVIAEQEGRRPGL
jgi:hypothetical protein